MAETAEPRISECMHETHDVLHELALILGDGQQRIRALEFELAALKAALAEEVVTRRVRVVDSSGRERIRLAAEDLKALTVTGANGVERFALRCIDDAVEVAFYTREADTYLLLHAGEENEKAEVGVLAVLKEGAEVSLGCVSGKVAPGATEKKDWIGPLPVDGEPMAWIRSAGVVSTQHLLVVDDQDRTVVDAVAHKGFGRVRCQVADDEDTWVEIYAETSEGSAGLYLCRANEGVAHLDSVATHITLADGDAAATFSLSDHRDRLVCALP